MESGTSAGAGADGVGTSLALTPLSPKYIRLFVDDGTYPEGGFNMSIKRTTRLRTLMQSYSARVGLGQNAFAKLRFSFNQRRVNANDTAESVRAAIRF